LPCKTLHNLDYSCLISYSTFFHFFLLKKSGFLSPDFVEYLQTRGLAEAEYSSLLPHDKAMLIQAYEIKIHDYEIQIHAGLTQAS
jgi:hypothetical protein